MGAAMTRSPLGAPPHGPAHRGQSPGERFFTVAAVAALLDVSVRTVRRWIKRGDLVAHRFGTTVRIAESDLNAFLARQRNA